MDLTASCTNVGSRASCWVVCRLPTAYATDDGVGLIYRGTEMIEAVADRPDKLAYLVERGADGQVHETAITPRLLSNQA